MHPPQQDQTGAWFLLEFFEHQICRFPCSRHICAAATGLTPPARAVRATSHGVEGDEAAKLWGRDADGEGDEFPGPIGWESIAGDRFVHMDMCWI